MEDLEVIKKDKNNIAYPNLKDFVRQQCVIHGASEQEMSQVYDHILSGLMK
jgi:hypothetical protein